MKNNGGGEVFNLAIKVSYIIYIILFVFLIVWDYISGKISLINFVIVLFCLIGAIILFVLYSKKSYIKIEDDKLTVGKFNILLFKVSKKEIKYNNIESIAVLDGAAYIFGLDKIYSVHIKEKNQEKKTAIDGFSKESFNEIKNILIGKGLPVSVSTMKGTKRETEDFNKNS